MRRIHIIGRKNHGKTRLVVELVEELASRGLRVGTIKHTHHRHELDTPGKDSHLHRAAGAVVAGILSQSMSAVFLPAAGITRDEDRYAAFSPLFDRCDIVIVEGDSQTEASRIEVWRAELGTEPIASKDPTILAVVTDDPLHVGALIQPRSQVQELANWLLDQVLPSSAGQEP